MADPTPICIPCSKEMTCLKNGVLVLYYSSGEPYKITSADMYSCKSCGNRQLKGFSPTHVEHWETPEFNQMLRLFKMQEEQFKIGVA